MNHAANSIKAISGILSKVLVFVSEPRSTSFQREAEAKSLLPGRALGPP
jgi:hypothetical protein